MLRLRFRHSRPNFGTAPEEPATAGAHQRTHAVLDGADQPIIPHSVGRCTTTVTAWALVTRITMRGSVGMWTYMIRWNVPPALAS